MSGIGRVVRGGAWLYVATVSSSLLGYLYWLLASRFVAPSTVGVAVAALGYVNILSSLVNLGVPIGVQRFLGRAHGCEDAGLLKSYFYSSLIWLTLISASLAAMFGVAAGLGIPIFGLSGIQLYFIMAMLLLGSGGWTVLYRALFNSTLRTEVNALSSIVSSTLRLGAGIILLWFGLGLTGVMLAFIIAALTSDIIYILCSKSLFHGVASRIRVDLLREGVKAGFASWIPNLVNIAGQWFGVIGLYALVGGLETGRYYMAFAIAMVLYSLPASILALMFPVLSGMEDGRKRFTYKATQISMVFSVPLTLALVAYPSLPLSLLGSSYLESSTALRLLLFGVLISPLVLGLRNLVYAYGRYREVTMIGLAENLPRVVLYPVLASFMAESGVAIAYVAGFLTALLASLPIAGRAGYRFPWTEALKAILPPAMLASLCLSISLKWFIGIPLILSSTLLYPKLGMLTRKDLAEISTSLLSKRTMDKVYPYIKPLLDLIY